MKKLVVLLLTSFALFSCGDDDSGAVSGLRPSAVSLNGNVRTYSYDEKGRMATVTRFGETATFHYNDKNQVETISSPQGAIGFTYDEDGKYASFTNENGQPVVLTYVGDDVYTANGETLAFHPNGDWKIYLGGTFEYSSGKGAFANVRHLNLLALAAIDGESVYFASKKRQTSVQIQTQTIPYVTIEGEKGLPESATVSNYGVSYTYSD
ncbi:hypothetical protein [Flavobacterium sp.]|uniref:hypothetical protein n=1 Tax=Flavobacterium sp. TaxID=239 RepID=UPI0011FDB3C9|nr:hypothetical protein [Flavobacterium sp.]RZJ72878.1 MAG: hypothetical protein EOO49_04390 [Flavobacterium sp.]